MIFITKLFYYDRHSYWKKNFHQKDRSCSSRCHRPGNHRAGRNRDWPQEHRRSLCIHSGKLTNDQAVSVAEHETNCGTGRHHTRQAPQTTLPTI